MEKKYEVGTHVTEVWETIFWFPELLKVESVDQQPQSHQRAGKKTLPRPTESASAF